jgi:hypothetical protein
VVVTTRHFTDGGKTALVSLVWELRLVESCEPVCSISSANFDVVVSFILAN